MAESNHPARIEVPKDWDAYAAELAAKKMGVPTPTSSSLEVSQRDSEIMNDDHIDEIQELGDQALESAGVKDPSETSIDDMKFYNPNMPKTLSRDAFPDHVPQQKKPEVQYKHDEFDPPKAGTAHGKDVEIYGRQISRDGVHYEVHYVDDVEPDETHWLREEQVLILDN